LGTDVSIVAEAAFVVTVRRAATEAPQTGLATACMGNALNLSARENIVNGKSTQVRLMNSGSKRQGLLVKKN
jgi:hypothetical protein